MCENFTVYTAACYFHESITVENDKLDEESNLEKLPVAIISNETSHDRNVAFTNNNWLISMVESRDLPDNHVRRLTPSLNDLYLNSTINKSSEVFK